MTRVPVLTGDAAAALVPDGATIALSGSGGGLLEADAILAALERRFLETGHPRDLTLVHAFGIGDRGAHGVNRFAHEGMVRRVIGGHWTWSPPMQQLARDERIEAYTLPSGVISGLFRESGARRPGLITRVGLDSFADPRRGGGRLNARARDELVRVIELDGVEYLHYLPIRVDVAITRGSIADERGNISFQDEPSPLDSMAGAMAARGNGGRVLVQVKAMVREGDLDPRLVHLPSPMVDGVVLAPDQWQTYAAEHDPTLSGAVRPSVLPDRVDLAASLPDPAASAVPDVRTIVARRAALEVLPGSVLNVGFGMSAGVVDVLHAGGRLADIDLCIEQGAIGGVPVGGDLFGVSRGPMALLSSIQQFDLFAAGMLDVTALGMAEVDRLGNVNVTRIGGNAVGPGGFVDISQGASLAVFCGTLTARGLEVDVVDGRLRIVREGSLHKFVDEVAQVSFSARLAAAEGRRATYVTERAVFRLEVGGITLVEVAEGLDPERDVIAHMDFRPALGDLRPMPPAVFGTGPLWGGAVAPAEADPADRDPRAGGRATP
jgi:acyl CoA:acetate/3-ketoacid CoA transferase